MTTRIRVTLTGLLRSLFLTLIGQCPHTRITWPQTSTWRRERRTTVTCLKCSREFLYDWTRMRMVKLESSIDSQSPPCYSVPSRLSGALHRLTEFTRFRP
jgi:hypothetical protein